MKLCKNSYFPGMVKARHFMLCGGYTICSKVSLCALVVQNLAHSQPIAFIPLCSTLWLARHLLWMRLSPRWVIFYPGGYLNLRLYVYVYNLAIEGDDGPIVRVMHWCDFIILILFKRKFLRNSRLKITAVYTLVWM